jgi:hypothetical protein
MGRMLLLILTDRDSVVCSHLSVLEELENQLAPGLERNEKKLAQRSGVPFSSNFWSDIGK